jgi:hypothetical protein
MQGMVSGNSQLLEAPCENNGILVCVAFIFQPSSVMDGTETSQVVGQELELD